VLGALPLAALAAAGPALAQTSATPSPSLPDPSPSVLDLDLGIRDLRLTVEAVDGSTAQTVSGDEVDVSLAADVFFAFGQDTLQPAATPVLADLAGQLRETATGRVDVVGHTDAIGEEADNLALSQRRAARVVAALQPLLAGTDLELSAQGRGESEPVAAERTPEGQDDPAGRARNRRVTISFSTG